MIKLSKHAKEQKHKRSIECFKVYNTISKGKVIMRCPYSDRYIISHKGTTVVMCSQKKTVITTYPNDYVPPTKLADVLDFNQFRNRLNEKKVEKSEPTEIEVELSYDEYMAQGKKKVA